MDMVVGSEMKGDKLASDECGVNRLRQFNIADLRVRQTLRRPSILTSQICTSGLSARWPRLPEIQSELRY